MVPDWGKACLFMEGKIDMAARRQVTNKLRDAYHRGCRVERGPILDRVVETTGMGRSTARRMLSGARLPDPKDQIDKRSVQARAYGDDTRFVARARVDADGDAVREVFRGDA
jgi:hypothetical protein